MKTVDAMKDPQALQPVYSTVDARDIRHLIEREYSIGEIGDCALLQCGFNDIYEITLSDGRHCIARLSSRRERGAPNVQYETALLRHLKKGGAAVAEPWATKNDALFVDFPASKGERSLVLFEYLAGEPPGENPDDIAAMGAELARIHTLSRTYHGPASAYTLDLDHLLRRPLARLLSLPALDADMRDLLASLAAEVEIRAAGFTNLKIVACHGDCHGGNTIMTAGLQGSRTASFFDFDDGGPGFQAYDLAVYLWGGLLGKALAEPDEELAAEWNAFFSAYLEILPVSDVDIQAISTFLTIRHFWLMGEYASRAQRTGLRIFRAPWFRERVMLAQKWHSLVISRP
ncbi:MAG: phosphotransferase enzyme family protein [Janthinobacterium lividum]